MFCILTVYCTLNDGRTFCFVASCPADYQTGSPSRKTSCPSISVGGGGGGGGGGGDVGGGGGGVGGGGGGGDGGGNSGIGKVVCGSVPYTSYGRLLRKHLQCRG